MSKEQGPACPFCDPRVEGDMFRYFEEYGRPEINLWNPYSTESVYVKPDVLPTNPEGHFLLVPRPHEYSFAAHNGRTVEAVGQAIHHMQEMLGESLVFFEHGGVVQGGNNMSVYHQHGHLVPDGGLNLLEAMADRLRKERIKFRLVDTSDTSPVANLNRIFGGEVYPYIYFQQGRLGLIAVSEEDAFVSQLGQSTMHGVFSDDQTLSWKTALTDDRMARLSVARIAGIIDNCKYKP